MIKELDIKFNFWKIIRFTTPSILMLIFIAFYTIVDGIFVSRFVSTTALSAINIVYPISAVILAISLMFGIGSSAIVSKKIGERKYKEARENFSFIFFVGLVISIIISIVTNIFLKEIVYLLGSMDIQFQYASVYARVLAIFAPLFYMMVFFQLVLPTAGKPHYGFIITIVSGVANIILDYVFIVQFGLGIIGAAYATISGYALSSIFGLIYFGKVSKTLYFVKPKKDLKVLFEACVNGSSEMVSNLANAVTTFLFNIVMIKFYGDNGVAAITIVLYLQFICSSIHIGFATGITPVVGYKFGEKNYSQLKLIFKNSLIFVVLVSLFIYFVSTRFLDDIIHFFSSSNKDVYNIVTSGFNFFAITFLLEGVNIFASAWFTALSNGKISAIISFLRTFFLIVVSIILLPMILGKIGIWFTLPFAELICILLSIYFFWKYKKVYKY